MDNRKIEFALAQSVLSMMKDGHSLDIALVVTCWANRDIMELFTIFPADIIKMLFLLKRLNKKRILQMN